MELVQPPNEGFVGRPFTGDLSGTEGYGASATASTRAQLGSHVLWLFLIGRGQLPREGFVGRGFIRDIRQANEKGL